MIIDLMIRGGNQAIRLNAQIGDKFSKKEESQTNQVTTQLVSTPQMVSTPQIGSTQLVTPQNSLNLTLPSKNNMPPQSHNMTAPNSFGSPGLLSAVGGGNGINTLEENFALTLQNPVQSGSTVVWSYNIPVLSANEKSLLLDMTGGQILILQAADADFPQQLCIYCDQLNGYLDNTGQPTHVIGIYRIAQILVTNVGGITAYTILYQLKDAQSWPMGNNRILTLQVGDFEAPFIPPLTSPVNLQLKIHHVSY